MTIAGEVIAGLDPGTLSRIIREKEHLDENLPWLKWLEISLYQPECSPWAGIRRSLLGAIR